ncbi:hypothetical protein F9U64_21170 [Gracilibacillus oryzae]|uniref:Uncharacterized protein n=1 Tax=Gracilibacillus oryzae TaxID=1672701 RepID=A0A7C8KS13_9BACI|nr:hypothetical protein [Gracilibacillus oryzae]KAB8125977.1 hypothetical protein F9U64_21170 [Gracilibacillus oryzae]
MRKIYSVLSLVFFIISVLPVIAIQVNYDMFTLAVLGLNGLIGVLMPAIYSLISLIFGFMARKKDRSLLLVFGFIILLTNLSLAFVGVIGFQNP